MRLVLPIYLYLDKKANKATEKRAKQREKQREKKKEVYLEKCLKSMTIKRYHFNSIG